MTLTASVREELASLSPSSVIELFELRTSIALHGACEIYRFHAGVNAKAVSGPVVWKNREYTPWPVEADGFEYDGKGSLPRPRIRIGNVDGSISAILLEINAINAGNDLTGAKVTRIRTLARFIDAVNFDGGNPFGTPDITCELPQEIYYIDRKSAETPELIEFELASPFDLAGVRAPKRLCNKNVCPWTYREEGCEYDGSSYWDESDNVVATLAEDVCGKRLSSCKLRFGTNDLPYGGFPGIGQQYGG
jgi:lambda family phage minor tail protein L